MTAQVVFDLAAPVLITLGLDFGPRGTARVLFMGKKWLDMF